MNWRDRRTEFALALSVLFFLSNPGSAVTIGRPVGVGTINAANLSEISGLVDARANSNVFWVHNDSGDSARFYAIDHQGALLGTFPLAGASAADWEDIAIGANPAGGSYLYLGDIGDNDAGRSSISIYRTPEPQTTTSATILAGDYQRARLRYPSGPRNAESLIVDPLTNDLFIITKSSHPEIYQAPAGIFDTTSITDLIAQGELGSSMNSPTAADISPDGRHILVRSKTLAYLFERSIDQTVADALHGIGIRFMLGAEPQGEAIGWAADGTSFYTTSEFDSQSSAPIHYYSFAANEPGDFDSDGDIDGADFLAWQRDSTIGLLSDWQARYGSGTSLSAKTVAVPETTTGILLLGGLAVGGFLFDRPTANATMFAMDSTDSRS